MTITYILSTGKVVKATAKNKRVATKFMNGQKHYAYTIVLEVGDYQFKTSFHDSVSNYWHNKGATKEMIDDAVYCIILDGDSYKVNPNVEDFINEFGYDDDARGHKVYEACKKTYEGLSAMLTEEEIDSLYEEAYEKRYNK